MYSRRLAMLIALAALAAAVFVLDRIAAAHYLYWVYWWYDIMMHFLGGVLIGGLATWVFLYRKPSSSLAHVCAITFGAILLVGLGWEWFEYSTGQYVGQPGVAFDTTLDLVMDVIGAMLVTPLVARFVRPHSSVSL
jgi:hypothetical protein